MNGFGWFASGLVLGIATGIFIMIVMQQFAADAQAARRAQRRALLGLPDRPPRRPGAQGSARVHVANFVERRPDSGMQQ
jgi:hypothetical protein